MLDLLEQPEIEKEPDQGDARGVSTRQLTQGWKLKIKEGLRARQSFDAVAEQCMAFYAGEQGFMYEKEFRRKYTGDYKFDPPFQVTVSKAFEMVAILGPHLFSQYPRRRVSPKPLVEIPSELFPPPQDQNMQQQMQMQMQQMQMRQQMEMGQRRAKAALWEHYLNYTPHEQPGGGMEQAGEYVVTEALLKGRGVMLVEPYVMPGSERILTRNVHKSVDDLVVDPDANKQEEWKWIAVRYRKPTWEVERMFGLQRGTLRRYGDEKSSAAIASLEDHVTPAAVEADGDANDLMEYWEIYSKQGVDPRRMIGERQGFEDKLASALDKQVGDYARLVVSDKVPWPLNMPPSRLAKASVEDVKQAFAWPIPFYKDGRWPVALLDFYVHPTSPYPIAPMAPGLGELIAINVLTSILLTQAEAGSKRIIAAVQSAAEELKTQLAAGKDLSILTVKEVHQSFDRIAQVVTFPPASRDLWEMRAMLMHDFDKRVGLPEVLYALNAGGVASRSATDASQKRDAAGIRPGHMAKKVECFLSECAQLERIAAYYAGVSGQDVVGVMGTDGAMLWDQLIAGATEEVALRDMEFSVEAGSARRPTHERDLAMIREIYQSFGATAMGYAQVTGNTGPLNAINDKFFKALGQDASGLMFGQWAPPQPPQQEGPTPEQQQAQVEGQKSQIEMQKLQMQAQMQAQKGQMDMQRAQADQAMAQTRLQQAQVEAQVGMAQAQAALQADAQRTQLEAATKHQELEANRQRAVLELSATAQRHEQQVVQDQEKHALKMQRDMDRAAIEKATRRRKRP